MTSFGAKLVNDSEWFRMRAISIPSSPQPRMQEYLINFDFT